MWPLPSDFICVKNRQDRASDVEFLLKYKMNGLLCFTLFTGLFIYTAGTLSNISGRENGSNEDSSIKDTLIVNNATQRFVIKVFERYSNENGSRGITIKDFYGLLAALRIGDVYNVPSKNAAITSPDEQIEEQKSKEKTSTTDLQIKHNASSTRFSHRQKYHRNVSDLSLLRACLRKIGRYMTLVLYEQTSRMFSSQVSLE